MINREEKNVSLCEDSGLSEGRKATRGWERVCFTPDLESGSLVKKKLISNPGVLISFNINPDTSVIL